MKLYETQQRTFSVSVVPQSCIVSEQSFLISTISNRGMGKSKNKNKNFSMIGRHTDK